MVDMLTILVAVVVVYVAYMFFPKKQKQIRGQIALVTGGGSGIGRLMALLLAKEGVTVVLWDINKEGADSVAGEINKSKGNAHAYQIDVTDREKVYKLVEQVKQEVGLIDILVNNAGVVAGEYFWDLRDDQIEKVMKVNALAPMWVAKAVLPDMMKRNIGHLVTISSAASSGGIPKLSDYCASKFAVFGWAESLRVELKMKGYTGIDTTIVCPFYIKTGMFEGVKNANLFQILDPDYVASKVIQAIKSRQLELYLPSLVISSFVLRSLLPAHIRDWCLNVLGLTKCMDEFRGLRKIK